jgi:hypothetical protein
MHTSGFIFRTTSTVEPTPPHGGDLVVKGETMFAKKKTSSKNAAPKPGAGRTPTDPVKIRKWQESEARAKKAAGGGK